MIAELASVRDQALSVCSLLAVASPRNEDAGELRWLLPCTPQRLQSGQGGFDLLI